MATQGPEKIALTTIQSLAVRRGVVLAWCALAWERLWSRLWTTAALAGAFIAVILTGALTDLSLWMHILVLAGAALGISTVAWRALADFAWPSRAEARARLESNSPVTHRPLTTVEDSLTADGGNPMQRLLWRLHQDRAKSDIGRLRAPLPAPDVAARDRFAVRAVVVLGLFVAIAGTWGHVGSSLSRGLLPIFSADDTAAVKLWITPPSYTGRSPIYVELPTPAGAKVPERLEIAAGSRALVMMTGATREGSLVLDNTKFVLDPLADQSQRGETPLEETSRLEIRHGARLVAGWDVDWIADAVPSISFVNAPVKAADAQLRIDYSAEDDYGLQAVKMEISSAAASGVKPEEIPVQMPPFTAKVERFKSMNDLAAHPWAGTNVDIRLVVTDIAGQTGSSRIANVTLPERAFVHPVSKELARVRKGLFTDPIAAVPVAREAVTKILADPKSFGADPVVHLALSTVGYRFASEPAEKVARLTTDLMWTAAIQIEDGDVAAAKQRLLAAERALREALQMNESKEKMEQLTKDLEEAVQDYQEALAEEGGANGKEGQAKNGNGGKEKNGAERTEQIAATTEELRQLSQMGSRDAARDALARLEQQLQELENGSGQGEGEGGEDPQMKQAAQILNDMRELAEAQAAQLDKNFKQEAERQASLDKGPGQNQRGNKQDGAEGQQQQTAEQGKQSDKTPMSGQQAAAQQDNLRQQLSELSDQIQQMTGERPGSLQDAEAGMRQASDAFKASAWQKGLEQQGRVASSLEKGMKETEGQLGRVIQQRMGGLAARDFGTVQRGQQPGGVPRESDTEGTAQRVRAIMDEIRTRASDRTRPAAEQEYLRRLMEQF